MRQECDTIPALPSWSCRIIALGGLAATTQFCRTQDYQNVTATLNNQTIPISADISCAQQYQLEWWSIFFELILLVIMLGTCFVNAFDRARFIYLTYLSLVTILLTQVRASISHCDKKAATGALLIAFVIEPSAAEHRGPCSQLYTHITRSRAEFT